MKTANGAEKQLEEWTLKDVKEYCTYFDKESCVNGGITCGLFPICEMLENPPHIWNLEEKPKFTAQEIEDAKTIMRIFGLTVGDISRDRNGNVILRNAHTVCGNNVVLGENSFHSIERGKSYTFQEIIGDSDA